MKNRIVAFGLMFTMAATALLPGVSAADENKAKNAAIGATALSAYLLMHHNTRTAGYVGAAGSAYLWKKYSDSRKARRSREIARENYYRRAAAHNARTARYYRTRYYAARPRATRTVRVVHRTTTRRYASRY